MPEIHLAEALTSNYSHVVAIPCLDERPTFVEAVSRAAKLVSGRVLAIIVVNARATAGESVHKANRVLIEEFKSMGRRQDGVARVSSSPPAWICDLDDLDLLVVDRSSDGFHLPEGQGVGLARRIGCDLALALSTRGQVASRWLLMTDADVEVSSDYFRAAKAYEGAALTYPFWHETDDSDQGKALSLYELSLRYYVLGLHWAGSSYAFQNCGKHHRRGLRGLRRCSRNAEAGGG